MDMMTEIQYWEQKFGLYPMPINPKSKSGKFLMLNGGNKDFCLQTSHSDNDSSNELDGFFSDSWSTNTKNFVTFGKDYVQVHNWLKGETIKRKKKEVAENPEWLYKHIFSQSYKSPDDVVPFIIGVFRELRNYVGRRAPEESLNLLFRLLINKTFFV